MVSSTESEKMVFEKLKENQRQGDVRENFVSGLAEDLDLSRPTVSRVCLKFRRDPFNILEVEDRGYGKRKILKVPEPLL